MIRARRTRLIPHFDTQLTSIASPKAQEKIENITNKCSVNGEDKYLQPIFRGHRGWGNQEWSKV